MKEDRGEGGEGGRDEGRTSRGGRAQRKHQGRRKHRGGGSTQGGGRAHLEVSLLPSGPPEEPSVCREGSGTLGRRDPKCPHMSLAIRTLHTCP